MKYSTNTHESKMNVGKEKQKFGLVLGHLLIILVLGFVRFVHGTHRGQPIRNVSAMYILGDSSVDCGENTLFYTYIHRNFSLIPCNGSDASLLPYLLGEKMGLPHILPFYSQNGSIEEIQKGLNFGSAEATIMSPSSQNYQSLNQQLRQLFETLEILELQIGHYRLLKFIRTSVVFLSFGKDDYIDLSIDKSSDLILKYNSHQFAHILATQMIDVIRSLYDMNVRKIVCIGTLPLGYTPRMLSECYSSSADGYYARKCVERINKHVKDYNKILREQIVDLNTKLPDALVVFCDVYHGINEIIANPKHYGFEDVNSACCGLGLYGATVSCLSMEMACEQSGTHVWWDSYNPTMAVNSLLADSAWSNQPFSGICNPMTIQELASASASHST